MAKKIVFLLVIVSLLHLRPIVAQVYAAGPTAVPAKNTQLGCGGGFGAFADLFCQGNFNLGKIFNSFVSNILGLLTAISALYFFFQFVTAGIAWIGAGGDKNSIEQARSKIFNAVIGLVVVASAWVLVGIIGSFVGLDILNSGSMIDKLRLNPTP